MRATRALVAFGLAVGAAALVTGCSTTSGNTSTAPPVDSDSVVPPEPSTAPTPTPQPTPDTRGGTHGTAEDPPQMQVSPADGTLESVTSAGVTYLLSAGGDRDAILHPARFWVDERSCLRVDIDDTEGYFAVLDPSVVVTSDGIVDRDANRHTFDAMTEIESQSIPRGALPPEFEAPCGSVTEDQLWGVGL